MRKYYIDVNAGLLKSIKQVKEITPDYSWLWRQGTYVTSANLDFNTVRRAVKTGPWQQKNVCARACV